MKAIQVGILVALLVVAALLFKVYQQQSMAQKVEPQAAATAAQSAKAVAQAVQEVAQAPTTPPAATQSAPSAAPAPAEKAEPPVKKPSPTRAWRKTPPAPVETPPAAPAETPPAPPAQVAAVPPSAVPPQQPAPAQPAPPEPPPAAPAQVKLTPPSGTQTAPREPHRVTIPAGTLLTVRLTEALSTDHNQVGDAFSATLDQPLLVEGFVIAERGARLEGRVLESEKAGRVRGTSTLAIHLIRLHTSDSQDAPILTEKFVVEGATSRREDATKVGAGAAIGAAIGAIAGGGKGAAIGAAVGGATGAGTLAATRGKPATLASETRISFKLQEAVTLTERIK